MPRDFKRILIVRTDRIGDVLLSTPVIKAMRDAFPQSHIAMMVSPITKEILEGNPYLNEIIVLDKKLKDKGIFGSLRFISLLRKKNFDLALILHGTKRVHLLIFLANIPHRLGYNRKWGFLLTKKLPDVKPQGLKHELEYNLDLVRALGVEPQDKLTLFPLNRRAEVKIQDLFNTDINTKHPVVCLHPGASCSSKRWMKERFADLAKRLIETFKANIVVVSGEDENLRIAQNLVSLINENEHVIDLSGKLSISELGHLLKRCDIFISNDSGPVHIAAAVGTPVISIFGRNQAGLSPVRWRPISENLVVLHKEVGCKVCLAHDCQKKFSCLQAISVDNVYQEVKKILTEKY